MTGRARYAYDIRLPGRLSASVLRSPLPHARIRRIDTSKAKALPGMQAILSLTNAPKIEWYKNVLLFDPILRFVGDEVAGVAAEELGLPIERVALQIGDTANGPYAPISAGSATQATIGPAVRAAAADAKRQLLEEAAKILEEPPDRLRVRDGKICVESRPKNSVPVEEVTAHIAPHMILGQGARGPNPRDKSL
ncbi:MAG TPA: hypothetical protein DEP84_08885 [Chloroflexi bacterium]|nr:hypothetical protein [Chloroflexota bacterium]